MRDWNDEVRARLAPLRLRPERERDIADEMAQHLSDRHEDLRRRGASESAAEAATLAELTDRLVPELAAAVDRLPVDSPALGGPRRAMLWDTVAHDVRFALRGLRNSPAFTLVAIATLGLGIGASTVMFTAVNGVLLRPLPYAEPDRIVLFFGTAPEKGLPEIDFPEGLAAAYRDRASRTVESVAAYDGAGFNLTGRGDAERIDGAVVTTEFFRVMGVAPLLGRTLAPGEDQPTASRVAVMSHSLWMRRFGGDSGIVGQSITLDGSPTTIVGVMPPRFEMPNRADLWLPLRLDPTNFRCWCYVTIARMKPGRAVEELKAEMAAITDDVGLTRRDVFPDAKRGGTRLLVMTLAERTVGNVQRPMWILFAAVACVLLIACANIANLMLARTAARSRELAVRCCLGASPRRVAAQILTESTMLSLAGAAAGAILAFAVTRSLRALPVSVFPRIDQISVDGAVLAFTTAIAVLTGLLCGVASAVRATRVDLQDAVKNGVRGSSNRGSRRVSDGFVVLQFGLSLVLLVTAGLLVRSYRNLSAVDAGYRPNGVVNARVQLPYPRYDSVSVIRGFYASLIDRIGAIPGVEAAGLASRVPLSGGNPQNNIIAEGKEPKPGQPVRVANIRGVSAGYFDAIGTPILRGRAFTRADVNGSARVAVVDESMARHFWPDADALGKRFYQQGDMSAGRLVTVVGIVPNIKHRSLDETPDLQVYHPFDQMPTRSAYLVVRTPAAPNAVVGEIRRQVKALDPLLPLYEVHTMQSSVDRSLAARRLTSVLLAAFSAIALFLAAIGIYGVISIGVNGRVREFGIRAALGATGGDVRSLVIRQGIVLALLGIATGLAGALWATRFLQGMLFGIGRFDAITFVVVSLALAAIALAATYLPARRATRADPILALRAE